MNNARPVSMSTISPQLDRQYGLHTTQYGNASMLVAPAVSCWEAWRWELTRATVQGNSTRLHRPEPSSRGGMTEVSRPAAPVTTATRRRGCRPARLVPWRKPINLTGDKTQNRRNEYAEYVERAEHVQGDAHARRAGGASLHSDQ